MKKAEAVGYAATASAVLVVCSSGLNQQGRINGAEQDCFECCKSFPDYP